MYVYIINIKTVILHFPLQRWIKRPDRSCHVHSDAACDAFALRGQLSYLNTHSPQRQQESKFNHHHNSPIRAEGWQMRGEIGKGKRGGWCCRWDWRSWEKQNQNIWNSTLSDSKQAELNVRLNVAFKMQTLGSGRVQVMACTSLTKVFSPQEGSTLSFLACCDNAQGGRADVRCQQHICIQPLIPPLHWPDNGAALLVLLLHLKLSFTRASKCSLKKKRKEKGVRVMRISAYSVLLKIKK